MALPKFSENPAITGKASADRWTKIDERHLTQIPELSVMMLSSRSRYVLHHGS